MTKTSDRGELTDIRCHDCGKLIYENELVRRDVGNSSFIMGAGHIFKMFHSQCVSLHKKCGDVRIEAERRSLIFWGIGIVVVIVIVVGLIGLLSLEYRNYEGKTPQPAPKIDVPGVQLKTLPGTGGPPPKVAPKMMEDMPPKDMPPKDKPPTT